MTIMIEDLIRTRPTEADTLINIFLNTYPDLPREAETARLKSIAEEAIKEWAVRDRISRLVDKKAMIEERMEEDAERLRVIENELSDLVNGDD